MYFDLTNAAQTTYKTRFTSRANQTYPIANLEEYTHVTQNQRQYRKSKMLFHPKIQSLQSNETHEQLLQTIRAEKSMITPNMHLQNYKNNN